MNKILVTGANGQLGSEIQFLSKNYSKDLFFFTDYKDLDITNYKDIESYIKKNGINTIINCAAYTAVDLAESETEISRKVNAEASKNLAKIAKENNCKFIHISTDYVFDGENHTPYLETDKTNPQSVYGETKLEGEQLVLHQAPANTIIIRTSWVYSSFGNNFVKTMLRLGKERESLNVIDDQIGSPTYARDLANSILNILPKINNKNVEIFHFSNEGVCSWFDFAKAVFEIKGINCKVNPIPTKMYPTPAKRPSYSVLSKVKIKEVYNINIPYWRDSLEDVLNLL